MCRGHGSERGEKIREMLTGAVLKVSCTIIVYIFITYKKLSDGLRDE